MARKKNQKDRINESETFIAFDIGLKRTGAASGSLFTKTATPAGTIVVNNGRHDWVSVDALIEAWLPDTIIIGDPHSADPHLNKAINRFKSHVHRWYKLPIIDVDERLTSSAANVSLEQRGLSQQRKTELRDQVAAVLILETYFNSLAGYLD
ncbi:MAG: putative Holliday junction resolvase [Paracoccaceae bacterium]